MTTQEVAHRFNEPSKQGNFNQIQEESYADNKIKHRTCYSARPSVCGRSCSYKKIGKMFNSMVKEVHSAYSRDPVVAGNHFSVPMGMNLTMNGSGRSRMDEIAVCEVKDGKIVKERFFF